MLRSKISLSVSAALLIGMVSLTGCGTNNTASGNVQTKSVRGVDNGRLGVKSITGGTRVNAFDKMEMSQELADRIAALPEVRSSHVMLTGRTAYVAVTLNEASGGVHAQGGTGAGMNHYRSGTGRTITGTGTLGTRSTGTGITGTGTMGMGGTGTGTIGRGTVAGNPGMTGMGGSITGIPGRTTGTGTVGGTGTANPQAYPGNAGNGVLSGSNYIDGRQMNRDITGSMGTAAGTRTITPYSTSNVTSNDVTQDLKNKIAAEIKKYNTNIDKVYVSANPDFVNRANFYAQEVRAGHPLKGFAHEFRVMVDRIFPTRSGY